MTFKNCPGACGKTLVPALATAPGTVSDNGLTWTYHLKSGVKFQDGTPVTSQDVKYAVERTFDRGVLPNGPNYFQTLLGGNAASVPGAVQGPVQEPDGPDRDRHARQHDGRVPPGETVLGLRLPGDDPADGPGAAGQGHRRQLPDAHRVHRPVRVPELPAEQDGGPGPEPAVERRAEPDRLAAAQQDRRQHEHEPQRRRQPAAGRRRPGRLRGHRRAGGGAGQDPGQPQPQGPVGRPAHRVRLVLLHRLAGGRRSPTSPAGRRSSTRPTTSRCRTPTAARSPAAISAAR